MTTPQDALDAAVAAFEADWDVHQEVGNFRLAPTGEPYVELTCGGEKLEIERSAIVCASSDSAIDYWGRAIRAYAAERSGRLYWRVRPQIEPLEVKAVKFLADRFTLWQVYCRLLISDKPQVQPAQIDKRAQVAV